MRAHRDGLATAFEPLREQIKLLKRTFWEKNHEAIEVFVRESVQRKLEERVATEASDATSTPPALYRFDRPHLQIEKVIKRYRDYENMNEQNNAGLKATIELS